MPKYVVERIEWSYEVLPKEWRQGYVSPENVNRRTPYYPGWMEDSKRREEERLRNCR